MCTSLKVAYHFSDGLPTFMQSAEGAAPSMNSAWAVRMGKTVASFSARLNDIVPAQHLRSSFPLETLLVRCGGSVVGN